MITSEKLVFSWAGLPSRYSISVLKSAVGTVGETVALTKLYQECVETHLHAKLTESQKYWALKRKGLQILHLHKQIPPVRGFWQWCCRACAEILWIHRPFAELLDANLKPGLYTLLFLLFWCVIEPKLAPPAVKSEVWLVDCWSGWKLFPKESAKISP